MILFRFERIVSLWAGLTLLFAVIASSPHAIGAPGPKYTEIVTVLETQPVKDGRLVYWDQSAADAAGWQVPPGRVGLPDFERAILEQAAVEIRKGTRAIKSEASHSPDGAPHLFVENDAHGGAGRAGYIEIQPGVWINIKGTGITGMGNTRGRLPSPPQERFTSHADGSATLEEAIKEAKYARVADAEMKNGASRVIAIIFTGRVLEYPDGRKVPLALIVRAPIRRSDQELRASRVIGALSEANSKRILKGDYVNRSNMGAYGEIVDLGCLTHTCGYGSIESSQKAQMFDESRMLVASGAVSEASQKELASRTLGYNLLNQLGVPEGHLEVLMKRPDAGRAMREIGESFVEVARYAPSSAPTVQRLDFDWVDPEKLQGEVPLHKYFRDAAGDFYFQRAEHPTSRRSILKIEVDRLMAMARDPNSSELRRRAHRFLTGLHEVLDRITQANQIADVGGYGKQLREIARFKNRDVHELLRPVLAGRSGELANEFVRERNPERVAQGIDDIVLRNRFGTTPTADAGVIARANGSATELFFRAFEQDGIRRLFAYPDQTGAGSGEVFSFRTTTDGWKSFEDLRAEFVSTSVGDYFRVTIPHGVMPVTWEPAEFAPFIQGSNGDIRWVIPGTNLRGPPLMFNERLGLAANFRREGGLLSERYGVRTSVLPEDLNGLSSRKGADSWSTILERLEDANPIVRSDAWMDIFAGFDDFGGWIDRNPAARNRFQRRLYSNEIPASEVGAALRRATASPTSGALARILTPAYQAHMRRVARFDLSRAGGAAPLRKWVDLVIQDLSVSDSSTRNSALNVFATEIKAGRNPNASLVILETFSRHPGFAKIPEANRFVEELISTGIAPSAMMEFLKAGLAANTQSAGDFLLSAAKTAAFNPSAIPTALKQGDWRSGTIVKPVVEALLADPRREVHAALIESWFSVAPVNSQFRSQIDLLLGAGRDHEDAIIRHVLSRPEVIADPNLPKWVSHLESRGGDTVKALLTEMGNSNWSLSKNQKMRSSVFNRAFRRGEHDDILAIVLGRISPREVPGASSIMSKLIDRNPRLQLYSGVVNSPAWIGSDEVEKIYRVAIAQAADLIAHDKSIIADMSRALSMSSRGSNERNVALMPDWIRAFGEQSLPSVRGVFHSPRWVEAPGFFEVARAAVHAFPRDKIDLSILFPGTPGFSVRHPDAAEIIELGVKAGMKTLPGMPHELNMNPLLRLACPDVVGVDCLQDAFGRGMTFVDAHRSSVPKIRGASVEATREYTSMMGRSDLDSRHVQALPERKGQPRDPGLTLGSCAVSGASQLLSPKVAGTP